MQAKAGQTGATRLSFTPAILQISLKANGCNSISRARAGGNSTLYGRAVQFGKQGLVSEQRIRFLRVILWAHAPPLKQSDHPSGDALHQPGYFSIGWLRQSLKSNPLLCILAINAIDNEAVQVDIQIYRASKALHKCHGAALRFPDSKAMPSPAAQP